tara:strand:+ start:1704 stop:2156 length:453 start_codon:yes stop_codon:yes gene_type:complete
MADSTVVQVHKKLAAIIAADYSSGFSGLNLTDKVVRGSVVEPPYIPFACVSFVDNIEDVGPLMGGFSSNAVFEIYCFAAGGSISDRSDASLNLVSDCIKALTADRTLQLSGLIDDIKCSYLALDGDRYGVAGIGIGYIKAEITFQSSTGA